MDGEAAEPLNIQEILQAAAVAAEMHAQLQQAADDSLESPKLRHAEADGDADKGPALQPTKWTPSKDYYKLPQASPKPSRGMSRAGSMRQQRSNSLRDRGGSAPESPHRTTETVRASTAPAPGSRLPARYVQTHHLYSTAWMTHREVRRGTQTALEACSGLQNDNMAVGDHAHFTSMRLAALCRRLDVRHAHEAALDRQIMELKARTEESTYRLKAETAIQTRLLSPCKRMDESEVADLIVKLGALKEALRECENWREVEREKHQQILESNIDRLMDKRLQLKSLKEQLGEEGSRLKELRQRIDQETIIHTNFFRSGSQQGGAGLGQLVQSSVLAGKGKQSPAKRAMARANLFGEDGVSAILHAMDQLPLMRRLGVLQGLSEKFSSVGQEVVHIQRALESTVVTSDSSLTDALNAVIAFITTIFPWSKFVAIYRVDSTNGKMWAMAPSDIDAKPIPLGQGLAGYAALSNSTLRTGDVRKHPSFNADHEDYVPDGQCCCICLPVNGAARPQDRHQIYGLIKIMGNFCEYTAGDSGLLKWVAKEVFHIMHNCQEFSSAVTEAEETKVYMRITMELCLKFEQKQVMMLAAQRLSDVLGAEMVIVYTLDRSSGELVGYTSGAKTQVIRRPLQGLLGAVFAKGGMESFEDVRKEQRYVSHVDQPPGVKVENMLLATMHSALLVTIGIVQVCNKVKDSTQGRNYSEKIYSENSKTLVGKVADDVAVAMENSRALKQMQERRLGMQDHRATASKMDTLRNLTYDIRDSLGCENAKVVLVNKAAQQLMMPDFSSRRYIHYPMGSGVVSTVAASAETVKVSEDKQWTGPTERVDNTGTFVKSLICSPAVDVQSGGIISVLLAVNKRRSGAFDAVDEKRLEGCCQKSALLLHNADLHDTLLQDQQMQSALADKLAALVRAQSDKFRFVQAVEELCFEMLHPPTLCHLVLLPSGSTQPDGAAYFPNYAGTLDTARKASLEVGVRCISTKAVVSDMTGDLSSKDEHTGESVLPLHIIAHPLVRRDTGDVFGALSFQREAVLPFEPTEELLFKIMAGNVAKNYLQMMAKAEAAGGEQQDGTPKP